VIDSKTFDRYDTVTELCPPTHHAAYRHGGTLVPDFTLSPNLWERAHEDTVRAWLRMGMTTREMALAAGLTDSQPDRDRVKSFVYNRRLREGLTALPTGRPAKPRASRAKAPRDPLPLQNEFPVIPHDPPLPHKRKPASVNPPSSRELTEARIAERQAADRAAGREYHGSSPHRGSTIG